MTVIQAGVRPDVLGPVDVVVVEFPDGTVTGDGFERLIDLVDRQVIRVLDVEFVTKDAGGARIVPAADLPDAAGIDRIVWGGASSGLLDDDDLAVVDAQIAEGGIAVVVVFENLWVVDLVAGWPGARLVLDGAVPADDLIGALDATESS